MQNLIQEYRGNYSTHIEMMHTRIMGKKKTYAVMNKLIQNWFSQPKKGR